MRKVICLIAVGLAAATTGCIENLDVNGYPGSSSYGSSGYGNSGYSNSAYGSNGGYYSQPSYYAPSSSYRPPVTNNYYTNYQQPQPQVVTQTRYVPVPTPASNRSADRSVDRRGDRDGDGRRDRADRPAGTTPPVATNPTPNQPAANGQRGNRGDRRDDRDGDGKPDAPRERRADRN